LKQALVGIFLTLVVSLRVGVLNASAQNDWAFSVNVSAKDIETKNQLDGVSILISDKITNARVHSAVSSADQKIKLNLEPGKDYVLKISKNGYVSKTISISTRNVPVFDKTIPSFIFDVSADIFTEEPNEDYTAFRQAFGMILFDEVKKDFIWIPNTDAKQKEEDLKEKRKEQLKKEEKNQKKNTREAGKDELETLTAKKEEVLKRTKEREQKRKEDQEYREAMRQEALASFNVDYDAPRMLYAKIINTETEEKRNYITTITKVIFEDGKKVVFRKIVFEWGGIYYKQDEYDITDITYNLLMKIIVLKQ
jgi:hypothetical protein